MSDRPLPFYVNKIRDGEAYNIAEETSDIKLKDLAALIAKNVGTKIVFELPDEAEKAGYSTATKARLDGGKLKSLGWGARYDILQYQDRGFFYMPGRVFLRSVCFQDSLPLGYCSQYIRSNFPEKIPRPPGSRHRFR